MARCIHGESSRAAAPFLSIDCSLYYERELEREVFGYRGEGPAGKSRQGLLEFAQSGSCFLSRVEELSPGLQESLLDFLRTGRFRRLGDGREISSGVRMIVASDRNLAGFVQGCLFDRRLFRELTSLAFTIAPLRERAEDISAYVEWLSGQVSREEPDSPPPEVSGDCIEALRCFPWPRNYDELDAELRRVFASVRGAISPDDLSFPVSSYWLGQRGDPEVRKVIEELDGYIREFNVLSRLDAEFGDILLDVNDWDEGSDAEARYILGQHDV